jgi:UDP-glucose 4-epimerase
VSLQAERERKICETNDQFIWYYTVMQKTVLVTGGAGYIGSHACKLLKEAGYAPVTFDNYSTGNREAVLYGPAVEGDLCNPEDLAKVFAEYEITAVMHFAALSSVGDSVQQPDVYWKNNVYGSMCLLDAMKKAGVENVIFSSTCATYGDHDGVLLTEDTVQKPTNPYGTSKQAIENMIADYGMNHIVFRYFNVAGADAGSEIGEAHDPETHLIPLVLEVAAGKRTDITIFGNDYDTADGTCVRDYVHVTDIADAHLRGLQALESAKANAIYNLGTGTGFSVQEIIAAAEVVAGVSIPITLGERRAGDCASLVSDGDAARVGLGWEPVHSNLPTMIGDAWRWHTTSR